MNDRLRVKIELLKDCPGVYLMKNEDGTIIYVGKAKSLIKRVKQYFYRPQSGKVFRMVCDITDFDTIETPSEKEALLLELNLIRKHYPKYNILLKDGKSYPFIALKKQGDPFLKIAYKDKDKSLKYFGPFPSSNSAYKTIDLLQRLYPLRKCNVIPSSPCLYYHLGQCLGPCVKKIEPDIYNPLLQDIEHFLRGDTRKMLTQIQQRMKEASENLEFEKAKEMKDLRDAVIYITQKQSMISQDRTARDVIGYSTRDFYLGLAIMTYREGKLLGKNFFVVEEEEDKEEQILSLLYQYYANHDVPKEIVCSFPSLAKRLEDVFPLKALVPSRGKKKDLLLIALENAKNSIDEHFLSARLEDNTYVLLEELGHLLRLPKPPLWIELFDNSHLQGESPIGAMVVFQNGVKAPSLYRKYNIKASSGKDDLASMHEVVYRRYKRLKEEGSAFPDLVIVDGGETQIEVAIAALQELQLSIPVAGLAKDDRHHTAYLIKEGEAIYLKDHEKLFLLLVRMQDEVHRYAIGFHRQKRSKKLFVSIFDDIKGIGAKRKEMLLKAYPSLSQLKNASIEELEHLVPRDVALQIIEKWKSENI